MRGLTPRAILSGFLVFIAAFPIAAASSGSNSFFPAVSGLSLEKKKFEFPRDFQGDVNLVIVTFQREQQHDADAWMAEGRRIEQSDPSFHYYELPTVSRSNPFLRWWLDSSLRSGMTDRSERERTITLYLNKRNFKNDLRIGNENTLHLFLVKKNGLIFWQSEGPATEETIAFLRIAMKSIATSH